MIATGTPHRFIAVKYLYVINFIYKFKKKIKIIVKKYAYGATGCTASSQCLNGTSMVCSGGTCTCVYPQYWNGTSCGKFFKIRLD